MKLLTKLHPKMLMALIMVAAVVPEIVLAADDTSTSLTNPLGTTDVRVLIGRVIKAALGVTGSIALLMFIWGGFLWLTAAGNTERIEKGRKVLIWTTIGLVIIFSAYTITNTVVEGITTAAS